MTNEITPAVVLMDAAEARQYVTWIKSALEDARTYLLELYEREGWRALGYGSWRACVQEEFGQSTASIYRQLDAAQTERVLLSSSSANDSPLGENIVHEVIPDSHLRELAPLTRTDPEAARDAYHEIQTEAKEQGRAPTAAAVKAAVHRRRPKTAFEMLPDGTIQIAQPVASEPVNTEKDDDLDPLPPSADRCRGVSLTLGHLIDELSKCSERVEDLQRHCRRPHAQIKVGVLRDGLARLHDDIAALRQTAIDAGYRWEPGGDR